MDERFETGRLRREWCTMQAMVRIYCEGHDHEPRPGSGLCSSCGEFLDYAARRLEKCPYGASKPTCAKCPIHCYKPQPREFAREVMRHAGPQMLWRHPWLSVTHLADKVRHVEHPMDVRRKARSSGSGR